MALEEKTVTTPVAGNRVDEVEEIIFRRDRTLPAPGLHIIVVRSQGLDGGERHRSSKRVPQAVVAAGWPGNARTLQAHLLSIIDAATE
jgi:hypothetical protein